MTQVRAACELWCEELKLAGLSARTIATYRDHVKATCAAIANAEGLLSTELELTSWDRPRLAAALLDYRTRPDQRLRTPEASEAEAEESTAPTAAASPPRTRSLASQQLRLSALRRFSQWCVTTELLEIDPTRALRVGSGEKSSRVRELATGTELAALAEAAADSRSSARDRLILAAIAGCGLTPGELAALRVADVDLGRGTLQVGARSCALTPWMRESAEAYLSVRSRSLARLGLDSEMLVVFQNATKQDVRVRSITRVCHRLAKAAGLPRAAGRPQRLRAGFAESALRGGTPVVVVCAQLGVSLTGLRQMIQQEPEALVAGTILGAPNPELTD